MYNEEYRAQVNEWLPPHTSYDMCSRYIVKRNVPFQQVVYVDIALFILLLRYLGSAGIGVNLEGTCLHLGQYLFYQKRLVTENPVLSINVSHPCPPLLLEPPGHILFLRSCN